MRGSPARQRCNNDGVRRSPLGPVLVVSAALAGLAVGGLGCSSSGVSTSNVAVAAAPPPKDDGKPAQGGEGGSSHAAALEELKVASLSGRTDKQNSVRVFLPDAEHWTRVRVWGVPSLVGFRYGKDHHAIVAGFVTHVDDNSVQGACAKSFEQWANPWIESFEVDLQHDAPSAFVWHAAPSAAGTPASSASAPPSVVEVDSVFAKTATLAERESYAAAWAAYPAWKGACLVVGVAVPVRDDEARAREVRDRFAKEILPKVDALSKDEPPDRY